MKKALLNLSILVTSIYLFTSCMSTAVPKKLPELMTSNTFLIDYAINRLEFIDTRTDTTSVAWKLPVFITKSKTFQSNPTLDLKTQQLLESQIKQYFKVDAKRTLNVKVTINEAFKRIQASGTVSEYVKVDIKTEMYELNTGNKILGFGTVYYDAPMVNATEAHLNKMYEIALKNAIHTAFSKVNEIK